MSDETVRDVLKELRRKQDSCRALATMSLPGWVEYRTEMARRWAQLADAVEGGLFDAMDEDHEMADRIAAQPADARAERTFAVESGTYTAAQFDGTACCHCGRTFAVGEASEPLDDLIDGHQLFAHIDICDEVAK